MYSLSSILSIPVQPLKALALIFLTDAGMAMFSISQWFANPLVAISTTSIPFSLEGIITTLGSLSLRSLFTDMAPFASIEKYLSAEGVFPS